MDNSNQKQLTFPEGSLLIILEGLHSFIIPCSQRLSVMLIGLEKRLE